MLRELFRKHVFFQRLILVLGLVLFVFAGVVNLSNQKPDLNLSQQDTALNVNRYLLSFLSIGNKRLVTDILWIQTLIASDTEHYKKKDLKNWMYLRFDTISNLDPKFYQNYYFGGQYLGIIKDDLAGANLLFEKGLRFYPDDYNLNYYAGFLNYFELGDFKKGLAYLEKIQHHPKSPPNLSSVINKLKVATGSKLEEVFLLVSHNYETSQDETLKKKLAKDLYSIRAEIDLECLNRQGLGCRLTDIKGQRYIKIGNRFEAAEQFVPYRIHAKK